MTAGRSDSLAEFGKPAPIRLPAGLQPEDVLAIDRDASGATWTWYADGTVSKGKDSDLGAAAAPVSFVMPSGQSPKNLVETAFDHLGRVHAWYLDGSSSIGDTYDLGRYATQADALPLDAGKRMQDIVGVAFHEAHSVRHVATNADGSAWVSVPDRGMFRLGSRGELWPFTETEGGVVKNRIDEIDTAPDGSLWIGYSNFGVEVKSSDGKRLAYHLGRHQDKIGLSQETTSINFDLAGTPWVTSLIGIHRMIGAGLWQQRGWRDPVPRLSGSNDLAFADDGSMWVSSGKGLHHRVTVEAGDTCAAAMPLLNAEAVFANLSGPDDVDLYSFSVDTPMSRIDAMLVDPDNRLELRSIDCDGLGSIGSPRSGSGRPIAPPASGSGRPIGPPGAFTGHEQRRAWPVGLRTGHHYLSVRAQEGKVHGWPVDYTLSIGTVEEVSLNERQTLILGHLNALEEEHGAAEAAQLADAVQALAEHEAVLGWPILDLNSHPALPAAMREAYKKWRIAEQSQRVDLAADFVNETREWIRQLKNGSMPQLRHILLLGDDSVIPHARLGILPPLTNRDFAGWVDESEYNAADPITDQRPISLNSSVGASLSRNLSLSDDAYGASSSVPWGEPGEGYAIDLPSIAVGRLVESPMDMLKAIRAFTETDGVLRLDRSLTAGYGFMQDGPELGNRYLEEVAGLGDTQRIELFGEDLDAADWRAALLDDAQGPWSLAYLAAHSDHDRHWAPDDKSIEASEIVSSTMDLAGRLVYGLACHSGLNVPGLGGTRDRHGRPLDLPEAWLRQGAVHIGSTGWAYGFEGALQYQEDLMSEFTRRLVINGGNTIGEALLEAKRDYYWAMSEPNAFHAKTLAGTILYGLPMWRVEPPLAGSDPNLPHSRDTQPELSEWRMISSTLAVQRQSLKLAEGDLARIDEKDGSWFRLLGREPRPEAGQPLQPRASWSVFTDYPGDVGETRPLHPRGIVWRGGSYDEIPAFPARVPQAGLLSLNKRPQQAAIQLPRRWLPEIPVTLRTLAYTPNPSENSTGPFSPSQDPKVLVGRQEGRVIATLGRFLSEGGGSLGHQQVFHELELDLYYAPDGSDQEPPTLDVWSSDRGVAGPIEVSILADDSSGIVEAYLAFDAGGVWRSSAMTELDGAWVGVLPNGSDWLAQVVDGAGNVAIHVGWPR